MKEEVEKLGHSIQKDIRFWSKRLPPGIFEIAWMIC